MKKLLLLTLALLSSVVSHGQYSPAVDGSPQSILLTESRIDRPLLMHKNQLQFNPGYSLSIITGTFDNSGSRTSFEKDGLASTVHTYSLDANYGLFDFLELNMSLDYLSRTESSRDLGIVGYTDFTSVSSLTEWKGLDDIGIGLGIKPWTRKTNMDLALRLGCTLPTASRYAKMPENTAIALDANNTQIDYHNFGSLGKGVPFVNYGFNFRYRFKSAALNLSLLASNGLGKSKSNTWVAQLDNYQFTYSEIFNKVKYPNQYQGLLSADFRVFSWFDLYTGLRYSIESGGWKEIGNINYALPQTSLNQVLVGYEILTTMHLRLLQQAQIAISGKNTDCAFEIYTSLVFSLFTSK